MNHIRLKRGLLMEMQINCEFINNYFNPGIVLIQC